MLSTIKQQKNINYDVTELKQFKQDTAIKMKSCKAN